MEAAPNGEIIVVVVYQCRYASIRVILRVTGELVFSVSKVQPYAVVCEAKLLKNNLHFPGYDMVSSAARKRDKTVEIFTDHPLGPKSVVNNVNCLPRDMMVWRPQWFPHG